MITKGPTLCHKAPDFSLQKENSDHINAMEDKNHVYSSDNTMERLPSTISEPGVERQENMHTADPPHWEHQHHHHHQHDHAGSSRGSSPEPYLVPIMYYAPMSPYYHQLHPHHHHHHHNGGSPPPPPPLSYMMYGSSPPAMPFYPPHQQQAAPHHYNHHHHQQQQQQQQYLPPIKTGGSSPPPPPQHPRSSNSAGDMMMTTATMAETVYGGTDDNSSPSGGTSNGQLLGKPKDRASARIARSQRAGGQYNPDQFLFNMEEALSGSPTARTTVMLKNIPNKYNQAQLMTMVEEEFKGTIDFLYLPVDFRTRCNLGYSFINFIDAAATAKFYQHFHGKKWEEDSGGGRQQNGNNNNNGDALSKKVAQVAYGRVQGKDALVNHFKDAKFPNNDEQWMPVVFEMDGEEGVELKPVVVKRENGGH